MKKKKPYAHIWAAICKKTSKVFLINDKLSDLKSDIGDDNRFRYAILREAKENSMGDGLKRARGSAMQSNLPIKVEVGQVWEDNDPRMTYRRRLKVLEIVGDKAIVQHPSGLGSKTKIRLDRFRPTNTGYRLVSE